MVFNVVMMMCCNERIDRWTIALYWVTRFSSAQPGQVGNGLASMALRFLMDRVLNLQFQFRVKGMKAEICVWASCSNLPK